MKRRDFLRSASVAAASIVIGNTLPGCNSLVRTGRGPSRRPNLVYVFADQWRAQALGYAGDPNAITPNLNALAGESVNFATAVSNCPVCTPYRASLMTGRYPLTHGLFLNDLCLSNDAVSIAQAYNVAGYRTGYIGKWHIDGHGRSSFTPPERRQGFNFWMAMECSHDYNNSYYYTDDPVKRKWAGYDAIAQTDAACDFFHQNVNSPFALFMSWGPPHTPYETGPDNYKKLFADKKLQLRPNVPNDCAEKAQTDLAGYYAHCAALDDCMGKITRTLDQLGIADDTILVFTSDHGDMLYSNGQIRKQRPWDESIRVPFLVRYPAMCGRRGRTIESPINTPDIMPTLLKLSCIEIPNTVEGSDFSDVITGRSSLKDNAALIACYSPFGEYLTWPGAREYRGIRTRQYTYVRDLKGPWLLYDNKIDPYQLNNLVNNSRYASLQKSLEAQLTAKLRQTHDDFLPGSEYIKKWGYTVDKNGTVPYWHKESR